MTISRIFNPVGEYLDTGLQRRILVGKRTGDDEYSNGNILKPSQGNSWLGKGRPIPSSWLYTFLHKYEETQKR